MLLAGLACLGSGVATARDPTPAEIKLNDIDVRLGRVEAVVNNQSLLEMSRRIDELETQLRTLRGAQEEAQNGGDSLRKQQRDLYADLDKRLTTLERSLKSAQQGASPDPVVNVSPPGATANGAAGNTTGSSGATVGNSPMAALPAAPASEDLVAYNRAFETLKSGSYFAAITQWQDFLKTYSRSKLLDNAQYWLGESYYVTRDFDNASLVFKDMSDRYPDSPKAADALLKLGYCQYERKKLPEARATLKLVQTRYPDSDAAKLAADRLDKMGSAAR